MSLHIHVVCGAYHLAVEGTRVVALCSDELSAARHAGLPIIDLRGLLAEPTDGETVKIIMDGFILAVDRVAGMVHATQPDFAQLPASLRRAAPLFDAVLAQGDDQLLRLNSDHRFIPSSPGIAP